MAHVLALAGSLVSATLFFALGTSEHAAPSPSEAAEAPRLSTEAGDHSSPLGAPVSLRSRFHGRIVDVHTHLHPASLEQALDLFDARGIALAVNLLPIPYRPRDWALVRSMEAQAKGRLIHFVSPPWEALLKHPDTFGHHMANNLEQAVKAGARGLKIAKALGLGAPAPEGGLLAVDDERLAPLWNKAGALGVPVAIHIGDPVAFWEPVTPDNERYEELRHNPGWSNYGQPVPSHAALMAAQARLFARHPKTTFIAVHVAGHPEDLDAVAALLDDNPHVMIDLAARLPALGHHPVDEVKRFFVRFQDRILFGTDLGVSPEGLMLGAPLAWREGPRDVDRFFSASWRYLETSDRDFAHPTPIQGDWTISGLGLDDAILEKIYQTNAVRLFGR